MSELCNFITVKTRGMTRLINLSNVSEVEPQGNSCVLKLVGGGLLTVDYSFDSFKEKLKDGSLALILPPSIDEILDTRGL